MHPECYLLDEPFAGLDETTTQRFLNYLREHTETYIIITHDFELLKETVDKIYILNNGKIEKSDISKDFLKNQEKRFSAIMP